MTNRVVRLFCTFFYIGLFPFAPGSLASLMGVFLYVLLAGHAIVYISTLSLIILIGFLLSGRMEEIMGRKDPQCVVIDEVAGMMIALLGIPIMPATLIAAFFLFRAFDMFKIYPANKYEKIKGSTGIMLDDLVAGVYANIVLQLAIILLKISA